MPAGQRRMKLRLTQKEERRQLIFEMGTALNFGGFAMV
jgi:hypothetical protein